MAINGVPPVSRYSNTDPTNGVDPTSTTPADSTDGPQDVTKNPKFMKVLNQIAASTLQGGQGMLQESMSKLYEEDPDEEPMVDDADDGDVV